MIAVVGLPTKQNPAYRGGPAATSFLSLSLSLFRLCAETAAFLFALPTFAVFGRSAHSSAASFPRVHFLRAFPEKCTLALSCLRGRSMRVRRRKKSSRIDSSGAAPHARAACICGKMWVLAAAARKTRADASSMIGKYPQDHCGRGTFNDARFRGNGARDA